MTLVNCSKELTGVAGKIRHFDSIPVADKQGLEHLRDEVIKQVSSKPYRLKMEGYQNFQKELENIISRLSEVSDPIVPHVTLENVVPVENTITRSAEPGIFTDLNTWNTISILLSVIAIITSFIALTSPKKHRSSSSASNKPDHLQTNSSREDNALLLNRMKDKQRSFEEQLAAIQTLLTQQHSFEKTFIHPQEQILQAPSLPLPWTNQIKYAKTADGNAFNTDALSDTQDNKKIYEITIEAPDKGSFRVTSNKEAQLFALEDPNNYLRGACSYRSLPNYNSTIITDKPGKIELNGNKWSIIALAEIDFS